MNTKAQRLGNVLFGLGVVLAVLWALLATQQEQGAAIVASLGLVPAAIGWALRYILNGAAS